ncbi:MAG: DUF1549 domain-containing protein [Planctomycetes bacterium]|nr:DUF1549 domain-containing protein [Planctomycetota bacterium]
MPMRRVFPTICVLLAATGAIAAEPLLHRQIDRAVAKRAGGPLAGPASDAEFMRRVYLDLSGTIPTSAEARSFLADKNSAKRQKLVDRLLAGPNYARRMQEALSVMLLERRVGKNVSAKSWEKYLRNSFAKNKPWDRLAGEILSGEGRSEPSQPAIKFFVVGGRTDQHQMTRDVARLFLGMDVQCAQCHDHPSIDEYTQADYFGLLAYLTSSKVKKNPKTQLAYFVETPLAGPLDFASVFSPEDKRKTGPRLPGKKEIAVPTFEKGKEIDQPAKDGVPAVPKFRPRTLLSEQLTSAGNERFKRNSVNRFWYLMMGRGLVHPLDLMHKGNPPSHPKLLGQLADRFAKQKFDVKWLLREMALSETYQRSGLLPKGVRAEDAPAERYQAAIAKPLSAEQLTWSLLQATGNLDALMKAAEVKDSKFTFKDYINGRIPLPADIAETMLLMTSVFGNPPGEAEVDFAPAVGHSLYLLNEPLLQSWLKPKGGNLVDRLGKLKEPAKVAEELYLSVLTRLPNDEENTEVAEYLKRFEKRRSEAIGELAWALLASAEFRLNH